MSTFPAQAWRKSSYSERKYCVEVAQAPGVVGVRDSKAPERSVTVTTIQWRVFLRAVKNAERVLSRSDTQDPHSCPKDWCQHTFS